MNNQNKKEDPFQPEYKEEQEFRSVDQTGKSGGSAEVDIQPSESESNIQNQTGDPGRTPGKAEGGSKTMEEDLAEKQNG